MSFWGKVWHGFQKAETVAIGVEHIAVPLIEVAEPQLKPLLDGVDGWLNRTQAGILSLEKTVTEAKAGGLREASLVADFQNGLETAQAALALTGKTIQYDLDIYKKVIADGVAFYNDGAAFKATWKIVDLPADPTPAT